MTHLEWIAKVNCKPWVDRSDGPDSFDCWGLVVDSYRRVDGVEIEPVDGYAEGEPIQKVGTRARDGWPQLEKAEHGCVFCCNTTDGRLEHVGRVFMVNGVLYAVHADGRERGQVQAHPLRLLSIKYGGRVTYHRRPDCQ